MPASLPSCEFESLLAGFSDGDTFARFFERGLYTNEPAKAIGL